MKPQLNYVTLVVKELSASRSFYVDGLGWPVQFESPGEVVMIRVGATTMLSLWNQNAAAEELGILAPPSGSMPFTLAHNLLSVEGVDEAMAEAEAAGANVVAAPVKRDWGGYSGYFQDPAGFVWEVAFNPFQTEAVEWCELPD
jgi:uncharacterized protein